jgi:hypothetical protein
MDNTKIKEVITCFISFGMVHLLSMHLHYEPIFAPISMSRITANAFDNVFL